MFKASAWVDKVDMGALSTPLNAVESVPAYDIWSRLIGPTVYQRPLLHAFYLDAFRFKDLPTTLPNVVRMTQSWLHQPPQLMQF